MKTAIVTIGIILTLILGTVGILAYKVYSAASIGNIEENAILAEYKKGRNILGQVTTKMMEMAQVTEMSIDAQERLIQAIFGQEGRAGNQAAWQWVQEQNPNIDTSLFNKLADVVNASRDEFKNHQTNLLARCQNYRTLLNAPIDQFFFKFAGYPDKNMENGYTLLKMCTPIESSHSRNAFETGIDDGINFKKSK